MKKSIALFGGLGLGAGLMYLFDPDKGNRRRAIMRDRGLHLSKTANRELNRKAKDLRNRAGGIVAETRKLVLSETATDEQLAGQIRTLLGRISSHPHAVKTLVEEGKVTVSGLILTDEIEPVLKGITSIGGVKEIENKLEAHASAEHISSLQGENRITTVPRRNKGWSPPARILAAAAGWRCMPRNDAIRSVRCWLPSGSDCWRVPRRTNRSLISWRQTATGQSKCIKP